MSSLELFLLAIGLSMDAFAVSVCKGLAIKEFTWKKAGIVGMYFGVFQAGMPLIGYILGVQFKDFIVAIDHWIAFILLALIGINMLKESMEKCDTCETADDSLGIKKMLGLAIATSVDALAVGITFAFLDVEVVPAVGVIGVVTLIISIAGVKIGHIFGSKSKAFAERFGGIILILIGCKILVEHLVG